MHVHALVILANVRRKVRRQYHDLAGDAAFPQFADQFDTGHVRHFFIDNDDIVSLQTGVEPGKGGVTVFCGAEFVARPGKDVAQGTCDRWLVVYGQDSEG